MIGCGMGSGTQSMRARKRAIAGAIENRSRDDVAGRTGSFVNILMASANGCRRP